MIKLLGDYENTIKVHYDEENEGVEINMSFFIADEELGNFYNREEMKNFQNEYTQANASNDRAKTDYWLDYYEKDFKNLLKQIIITEAQKMDYTSILNEDEIYNFTNDKELVEYTNKHRVVDKIQDMIRELEQMKIEMMDE